MGIYLGAQTGGGGGELLQTHLNHEDPGASSKG